MLILTVYLAIGSAIALWSVFDGDVLMSYRSQDIPVMDSFSDEQLLVLHATVAMLLWPYVFVVIIAMILRGRR